MIKKIIILSLVFSPLAFSQELSEAYLESLPESVKEDVLKGIEDREEKDKVLYRRPSTMIDKTQCKVW